MSTLTLIRHGQASFGAARYDTLSELGERQSRALGDYLSGVGANFDQVWVGPRDRHRLTARYALERLDADWQVDAAPALDEFAEGQQILAAAEVRQGVKLNGEGALRGKEAARCYVREIRAWASGETEIPGVPDAATFRKTVGQWRDRLTASAESGAKLVAVTSGGVIAALLADALDLPDAAMAHFMDVLYNASITEFAFTAQREPALVSFNQITYLAADQRTRI